MVKTMKLGVTLFLALAGCNSCQPTPPLPVTASDQNIYSKLVEAGCMKATDAGAQDVAQERALNPPPAWFNCLANGGAVADCNVPSCP